MSRRESIFRITLLDDGRLECEDWRGNTTVCGEADLGKTVRLVLADPDLPPVERVSAGGYNMAEAYARMVLPERYQGLVRPAASLIVQAVEKLVAASNEAGQRRAEAWRRQQQRPPGPPEPPPQHPPRGAHRRGRNVA
jgi:hypothetical protein